MSAIRNPFWAVATVLCIVVAGCSATPQIGSSSTDLPANANQGAAFDLYIMDTFGDYEDRQLGAISSAVSGFCFGLVDRDSISALTTDSDLQDRILGTRNCDDFETTSALLKTSESPDAATFEDSVAARFERVVWWGDANEFLLQAAQYCEEGRSLTSVGGWRLDLSVSAAIELDQLAINGECELPRNAAVPDSAVSEDARALETPLFGGEPIDATLYYIADTPNFVAGEPLTAIHLGSGNSVEVAQLTDQAFPRGAFIEIQQSPTMENIFYDIEDEMFVGPSFSNKQLIGFTQPKPMFSPDGDYVIFDGGESRFEIVTGEITEYSINNDGFLIGVVGNFLIYRNCEDDLCRLSMLDAATGNQRDSIQGARGDIELSQSGGLVLFHDQTELVVIEVTQDGFAERSRTARLPDARLPIISPDGQWLASAFVNDNSQIVIAPSDLSDSSDWVEMIGEPTIHGALQMHWTPDSNALIWFNARDFSLRLKMMDRQGNRIDPGFGGFPIAVVAGDPEGLN